MMSNNADPQVLAEAHIPHLQSYLERIVSFGTESLSKISLSDGDEFVLMALAFSSRQLDHGSALLALRHNRDAELIARTMLEGMSLLKWAAQDKNRASGWMRFAAVENWRTMRDLQGTPDALAPDAEQRVLEQIDEFGPGFLTKKARQAREAGMPLPDDPYQKSWFGGNVRTIFETVAGERLYDKPYAFFSAYHHWSSNGVLRALDHSDEGFRFIPVRPLDIAGAYSSGIRCLLESLEVTLRVVAPEQCDELGEIRREYLALFSRLNDGRGGLRPE